MNNPLQIVLAFAVMIFSTGFAHLPEKHPAGHRGESVILVHGIYARPFIMKRIEWTLEREGYEVINWGYPSGSRTIEENAGDLARMVGTLNRNRTIHFVGFSLGGLILRYYLARENPPNAGRLVMIAPPNHGSEKADALCAQQWFRRAFGTASLRQLRTGHPGYFRRLGVPPVEFGIIAGGRGNETGYSGLLPGDDDGAVSTQSVRLDGAADFILLHHQHTALVWARETSRQVVSFIGSGRFEHKMK